MGSERCLSQSDQAVAWPSISSDRAMPATLKGAGLSELPILDPRKLRVARLLNVNCPPAVGCEKVERSGLRVEESSSAMRSGSSTRLGMATFTFEGAMPLRPFIALTCDASRNS